MNNAYKLVYSTVLNAWVAVAEHVRGRGKQGAVRLIVASALLAGGASGADQALAAPPVPPVPPALTQLPTGAQVAAGTVSISQSQTATTASMAVQQSSSKAIVNWQSFNVGANAQVNITQPDANSVLLNRVLSSDPSQIFGQIKANGQVFLTNPNGAYFAPGSSVDVGSFTATTHGISDTDFLNGHYKFNRNDAAGGILNEGHISASLGGYIALLAPEVRNQGVVVAQMGGTVALAAGESYQLQFNSNKQLTQVLVTPATIQTLVDNAQAVQAPGGLIIMSAQAASGLLGGVVKNSGAISATGLVNDGGTIRLIASHKIELTPTSRISADAAPNSAGSGGHIDIIADLNNPTGITQVDGAISAKGGEHGGDGGFIETSATHLKIADSARVSTLAPQGQAGNWLLDPNDFEVSSTGNISGSTLSTLLASGNVTLQAGTGTDTSSAKFGNVSTTGTKGDINIYDTVSWNANSLTLNAGYNINVGSSSATGSLTVTGSGSLNLNPSSNAVTGFTAGGAVLMGMAASPTSGLTGGYLSGGSFGAGAATGFNGQINVSTSGTVKISNTTYSVINSEAGFVGIASGGNYVMGSQLGFSTVYTAAVVASFGGKLNGFGHVISGLNINNASASGDIGLFGRSNGNVSNLGVAGSMVGKNGVGAIAGYTNGLTISRSYSTVAITGDNWVGGFVGLAQPVTISESYSTGDVTGNTSNGGAMGGLVGFLYGGSISNSYATGAIRGVASVGGLVGSIQNNSSITNSFATGDVIATQSNKDSFGGLVGYVPNGDNKTITKSYATGAVRNNTGVTGTTSKGGLIGNLGTGTNVNISDNYWNSTANPSFNVSTGGTGNGTVFSGISALTSSEMKSASSFSSAFGNTAGSFTAASGWGYGSDLNGGFPVRCGITQCTSYSSSPFALTYNGASNGLWSIASNWVFSGTSTVATFAPTSANVGTFSALTVNAGAIVNYDTASVGSLGVPIANAGTIAFTGSGNVSITGVISGNGSVTKAGTGTVTFSGANTFSGGTTVSAGTLTAGSGTALGAGALTLGSTSVLDLTHSGTVALGSNLLMSSGAAITNSANTSSLSVAGVSTLAGSINTAGNQTYTGAVTLAANTSLTTLNTSSVNTNGTVTFGAAVNSSAGNYYGLTVNNGTGTTAFGGVVGGTNPLGYLCINAVNCTATSAGTASGSGSTTLAGDVTTSGTQTYGGNLTLGANTVLTTTANSGNGAVTVAGAVNTALSGSGYLYLEGLGYTNGSVTATSSTGVYLFGGNTYTLASGSSASLTIGTLTYNGVTSNQSSYTFVPNSTYSSNFLIVGGGGGGGADANGGGGGGGVVTNAYNGGYALLSQASLTANSSYSVLIGSGGAVGVNGYNSVAFSYTALGGGYGYAASGGSGGGRRGDAPAPSLGLSTQYSSLGYGFGYPGGGAPGAQGWWSSGGGGAGGAGQKAISGAAGAGGAAYQWVDGNYYAGGGGGAGDTAGLGGGTAVFAQKGGGGDGGFNNSSLGYAGTNGTGGGGGGAYCCYYGSGSGDRTSAGGSGVVSFSYNAYGTHALTINTGTAKSSIGGSISNVSSLTINSTSALSEITGAIGGSTALTKSGAGGALMLSGANTNTGGTTISGGTLKIGHATALGGSSGGVSVASGAALDLNGTTMTNTNTLTLRGTGISEGGALTNSSSTAATYAGNVVLASASSIGSAVGEITASGVVSGAFALTKVGAASLSLTGSNSYTGTTTISAGTLKVGSGSALGSSGGGAISVASLAALDLNGFGLANTNTITLNGTGINSGGALINSSNTGTAISNPIVLGSDTSIGSSTDSVNLSGVISGAGNLTKIGAANSTLSGINTYTGTTTVSGGILAITTAQGLGDVSSGTIVENGARLQLPGGVSMGAEALTLNGGSTLALTSASNTSFAGTVALAGTSNVRVDSGGQLTLSGVVSGTGGLYKIQPGALLLTGTNTYSGGTSFNATGGTLQLGSGGTTGSITGNVVSTGGTLVFNRSDDLTYAGAISGTGAVTKLAANTLTFTGNNTYSGGTTISAGTLKAGSATALGTAAISVSNGAALDLNGQTMTSTGLLTLRGTGVSATGALLNSGSTAATYAGALALGANSSIMSGSTITSTISLTNTGALVGGGFTLTLGGPGVVSADNHLYSIIDNTTAKIIKNSSFFWTFHGNNSYSGGTDINAGTIRAGSPTALGSGAITVASGGSLDLRGQTMTSTGTLSLNGTGFANLGALRNSNTAAAAYAGPLVLAGNANVIAQTGAIQLTHTGTITGATFGLTLGGAQGGSIASIIGTTTGSLTKQDGGTWTLSGANTYTGGTTVSAGTLKLGSARATGTGAIGVSSGAALDLNGQTLTSTGALTLNGTGVASGGALVNSSGTAATYAGAVTLASDSSYGGTGAITFGSTVNSASSAAYALSSTSAGNLVFNAAVGASYALSSLSTGTGTTTLGGNVTTVGAQTYGGPVVIKNSSGVTLANSNSAITFGATVDSISATSYALTLSNGTGATTFTGAIGATEATGALTVNGTGTITLGGNVTTKGDQIYAGPVSASAGIVITANSTAGTTGILTNGYINNTNYAVAVQAAGSFPNEPGEYDIQTGTSSAIIGPTGTIRGNAVGVLFYNTTNIEGADNGMASGSSSSSWCCYNVPYLVDVGRSTLLTKISVSQRAGDGQPNRLPTKVYVYGSNTPFTTSATMRIGYNNSNISNVSVLGTGYQQSNFTEIGNGTLSPALTTSSTPALGSVSFTNTTAYRYYQIAFVSAGQTTVAGSYARPLALQAINLVGSAYTPSSVTFNGSVTASGALTVNTAGFNAANMTAGGPLTINNTGTGSVSGVVSTNGSNPASLVKQGDGTLTLSNTNTYTGGTTVSAGTLQLGAGLATGSIEGNVTNNATLAFNRSDDVTYAGAISGTGAVTKLAANTLTFTGNNTYAGVTTISAGTLQVGAGGTSGAIAGNVTNNATLAFNRSDTVTQSGVISGSGALMQSGGGTTTLTGANTYTGATTVSAGTLAISHATGLGGTGTGTTVASGATLDLQGVAVGAEAIALQGGTLATSTGTSSLSGGVTMAASSNFSVAGTQLTLSGVVSGTDFGVTKTGSGSLVLSGNNNYSGATSVSAGTLAISHASGLGATAGGTTVASGATLDLRGAAVGAEAITLNGGTLTASTGPSSLSGAVNLTSASILGGAGALTLSGAITSNSNGLALLGTGAKILSSTSNTLHTIATGSGVGALNVVNNAAMTIGQVTAGGSTYSGIDSTGTVSVVTRTGDLTVSQNVVTTSTAIDTTTPALKLGAGSLSAAGTPTGGDVVLSGTPTMTVGTGGLALIYSGYATTSAGRALNASFSPKRTYYTINSDITYVPTPVVAAYFTLYRESPGTLYTLYVPNQRFTYGTPITSLNYCYSTSASSCSPVTVTGVPSTTQAVAASGAPDVGSYPLQISPPAPDVTGYFFRAGNAVNIYVDPKPVTIATTARTTTYNGLSTYSDLANAMTYTVNGLVGYDAVSSVTRTPSGSGVVASSVANAGSFTVTPSAVALSTGKTSNYTFSYTAATATVDKANLTVTAKDDSKFIGEADASGFAGVRYTGFVAGQTASVLSGTASVARSNASVGSAGTYSGVLSAAGSTLSSNNYNISYVPGSYTIVPADQLLIRLNDASTTYGTAPSYSVNSVQYKSSTGNTVVDLTNRAAINTAAFTLTDGAGGNTALTLGPLLASLSSGGQVAAGSYQVGASNITNTSDNYGNTVNIVGSLAVAQKTLTPTATSGLSKSYDGTTSMSSLGFGLSGVVGADAVRATGVGTYANANAGNAKSFAVSGISLGGSDASNYKLASNTLSAANGAITAAPLLITANNDTKTYDATAYTASAGVSYSGFVNGETASDLGGTLAYSGSAIGAVNVGNYVITPSGQTSSNYAISFGNGGLYISPADVRVSATNVALTGTVGKEYDGTPVATLTASNYVTSGWQGSDGANITQTTGTYDNANAGINKLVSVTLASSDYSPTNGTLLSNYNLPTAVSGNVGVIRPKTVTVTNADRSTTYDGVTSYASLALGTTYSVSDMVGSDAVASVSQTPNGVGGVAVGTAQAGTFNVTPSAAVLGTGMDSNYSFSYIDSTHTVDKAALTATGNSASLSYTGQSQSVSGFTVVGLLGNDTVADLRTVAATGATATNAGTYTNTVSAGAETNYNVSTVNGSLVMTGGPSPSGSGSSSAIPVLVVPPAPGVTVSVVVAPLEMPAVQANGPSQLSGIGVNANSVSAVVSQDGTINAGVVVNTISQSSQQTPGLVAVLVPSGTATSGTGVTIALPESLFAAGVQGNNTEQVTLPDQRPLPAWIRYDAINKTLVTGAVPEGAFPITLWVNVDGQVTVVQISEKQANL